MKFKAFWLAALLAGCAGAAMAQPAVPYTFANQRGNVPASELDSNFNYLLNFSTAGGGLFSTANSWSALQALSGNLSLPSLTSHAILVTEGTSGLSAVHLGAGQLLIGQASGDPLAETMSGDASIAANGAVTLNGSVYGAPGACGSSTAFPIPTINGKGLVTNCTTQTLGSAAFATLGTSGTTVPLLNGANIASGLWTFSGGLSASSVTFSWITGASQCLQVSNTGVVSGTGGACGGSPLANNNTWTGTNNFTGALQVNGAAAGPFFAGTDAANLTGTIAAARLPSFAGLNVGGATAAPISGAASLNTRFGAWCDPVADYGADPTGAVDSTNAINSCLSSGRPTRLPAGTFLVGTGGQSVVVQANEDFGGAGIGQSGGGGTVLKLAAAANVPVVETPNAITYLDEAAPNSFAGVTVAVHDMTIDGNCNMTTAGGGSCNQSATGNAIWDVDGIAIYSQGWNLYNLQIQNVQGIGVRTSGYPYGGSLATNLTTPTMHNVNVDTVGRTGIAINNHDANVKDAYTADASQEADNTYAGFQFGDPAGYQSNSGNGRVYNEHSWHRSAVTNRMSYGIYDNGGSQYTNLNVEGGRRWMYVGGNYTTVTSSNFYSPYPGYAGSPGIVVNGSYDMLTGSTVLCTSGNANAVTGIYLQNASNSDRFDVVVQGCGNGEPIVNFSNSGGLNRFTIGGYLPSGAAYVYGTPWASDVVNILSNANSTVASATEYTLQGVINASSNATITTDGNTTVPGNIVMLSPGASFGTVDCSVAVTEQATSQPAIYYISNAVVTAASGQEGYVNGSQTPQAFTAGYVSSVLSGKVTVTLAPDATYKGGFDVIVTNTDTAALHAVGTCRVTKGS